MKDDFFYCILDILVIKLRNFDLIWIYFCRKLPFLSLTDRFCLLLLFALLIKFSFLGPWNVVFTCFCSSSAVEILAQGLLALSAMAEGIPLGHLLLKPLTEKKKLLGLGCPMPLGRKQRRDTDLHGCYTLLTDGISHQCSVVQWWLRQLRASLFPMDQVTHWAWLMEQGWVARGLLLLL